MVPIIETERLKLRAHRIEDFRDCAEMWAHPDVVRFIGGKPFSAEEVWAKLLRYVGHWQWMEFGFWAMEEKATGAFVGELGFAEFKREMETPILGVPEIGWALTPRAHGQGYATEGVRSVVAWGDERFGSTRTVCLIHPENLRSIRVAEKCGYKEIQRATYRGEVTIVLERPRLGEPGLQWTGHGPTPITSENR